MAFAQVNSDTWAFFTFMLLCIMNYDIRILSALKTSTPGFVCILSPLKCGQNADRNYQHKSKKCGHMYACSPYLLQSCFCSRHESAPALVFVLPSLLPKLRSNKVELERRENLSTKSHRAS